MSFMRHILPIACLALATTTGQTQNVITYNVVPDVQAKALAISVFIPHIHDHIVRVQMPVWAPGAYFVGNFATGVTDLKAETTGSGKHALPVYRVDPNTWEIAASGAATVEVQYTLKNADIEAADGKVPTRGHISGPRSYIYVEGRKAEPVELRISPPAGAKNWPVITSLDPIPGAARDSSVAGTPVSRFSAPTYDVMADAPVEMGNYDEEKFEVSGKPHSVLLYGDYKNIDKAKLTDYCKRIATVEEGFFGGAPFHRYIFQFRATSSPTRGVGGLEHLGSTEIGTLSSVNDRTRSVIAHEFFHLWNVKRIRPFVLGPFNYVDPPHTANLWWSEGVTSYYGDLLSLRAGLNTHEEYFKHLAETVGLLQNASARLTVSADESSMRVWEANNSSGYGGLSYYTKGELAGLCLDLKIRHESGGKYSLDDVMRSLWEQVKHGEGPGFAEDDIEKTINHVSGKNLSDFYDLVIRSTAELPFDDCLGYAGLKLTKVDPPKLQGDAGLTPEFTRGTGRGPGGPGGGGFGGMSVGDVAPGGAADTAGIRKGDRIVSINGSTEMRGLGALMNGSKPGEKVTFTISRNGANQDIVLTMGTRAIYTYEISVNPSASPEQVELRDAWLKKM